jgi:hypothetical protein
VTDEQAVDAPDETNTLVSRLRVIEEQPLETRAVAFAQIYDELQGRLDSGDAASPGA